MDSAAQVPAAPVADPSVVGRAFVVQYYHVMHSMPDHLYRFYKDISKVGRVGQDGVMRDFTTIEGIREELNSQSFGDFASARITSYHTQASLGGGFLHVVTGWFTPKDGLKRKFAQNFFLAPQENGYFVLNDILRFANEPGDLDGENSEIPCPISAPTGGIQGSEQTACVSVDSVCQEVSKPFNNENDSVAKENDLVPELVNEQVPDMEITCKNVAGDSLKTSDPDNGIENAPKKSYASVLKVAKDNSGVSAGNSLSPKQIPKDQEHQVTSDVSTEQEHQVTSDVSTEQILKDQGHQASSDPSPVEKSDAVSEAVDATEDGHDQGFEAVAEGTSIYVRHLPANATIDMLETEFRKFGAIGNGGIQVVSQRGLGYPYGFVEFEEADAAQKAIEASPLRIGGQKAFVEEKRSTARGNRGGGSGYGNRNVGASGGNEYGNRVVGGDGGNGYGNRSVGRRGGRGGYGYGNNYRRGGAGGGRSFNRRGGYEYVASVNT